jgi:hypothetical protein
MFFVRKMFLEKDSFEPGQGNFWMGKLICIQTMGDLTKAILFCCCQISLSVLIFQCISAIWDFKILFFMAPSAI